MRSTEDSTQNEYDLMTDSILFSWFVVLPEKHIRMQVIGLFPFPAKTKQFLDYQIKWNGPWIPI